MNVQQNKSKYDEEEREREGRETSTYMENGWDIGKLNTGNCGC